MDAKTMTKMRIAALAAAVALPLVGLPAATASAATPQEICAEVANPFEDGVQRFAYLKGATYTWGCTEKGLIGIKYPDGSYDSFTDWHFIPQPVLDTMGFSAEDGGLYDLTFGRLSSSAFDDDYGFGYESKRLYRYDGSNQRVLIDPADYVETVPYGVLEMVRIPEPFTADTVYQDSSYLFYGVNGWLYYAYGQQTHEVRDLSTGKVVNPYDYKSLPQAAIDLFGLVTPWTHEPVQGQADGMVADPQPAIGTVVTPGDDGTVIVVTPGDDTAPSTGSTAPKVKTAKVKTAVKGVTKRIRVKAHGKAKVKVKQSFSVTGGKRVVKVQQKAGGKWKPVKGVKVKVKANGKAKVTFKAKVKSKSTFRVKVAATKQFKAATAKFKVITRK